MSKPVETINYHFTIGGGKWPGPHYALPVQQHDNWDSWAWNYGTNRWMPLIPPLKKNVLP